MHKSTTIRYVEIPDVDDDVEKSPIIHKDDINDTHSITPDKTLSSNMMIISTKMVIIDQPKDELNSWIPSKNLKTSVWILGLPALLTNLLR